MLILQSNGLDFIKISPDEATRYDLIFMDTSLVTKLPIDLTPDELAPPLPWSQMRELNVCVINENYFKIEDVDRDMRGISYVVLSLIFNLISSFSSRISSLVFRNVLRRMIKSIMISRSIQVVTSLFVNFIFPEFPSFENFILPH